MIECECGRLKHPSAHACRWCAALEGFYDEPTPSERILGALRHHDWIETVDLYEVLDIADHERNKYQVTLGYLIRRGRIERRKERYRMARHSGTALLVRLAA